MVEFAQMVIKTRTVGDTSDLRDKCSTKEKTNYYIKPKRASGKPKPLQKLEVKDKGAKEKIADVVTADMPL